MKDKISSSATDYFIQNMGQIDSDEIMFYSSSGNIYFTPTGVMYRFREMEPIDEEEAILDSLINQKHHTPESYHEWGVVLEYSFMGSNNVIPKGRNQCSWNTNYFKGSDPESWHTEIPNYKEIIYPDLWEGIDLVYRLTDGMIKYDIIIHPGADPYDIQIKIEGAKDLSISQQGDLVIGTEYWDIVDQGLFTYYQDVSHEPIPCKFELINEIEYSFSLGEYDKSRTVVIDPFIAYSTFIGGSGHDYGEAIEIDSKGNAYIIGITTDDTTNYPTTTGVYDITQNGGQDVFVTKLNSDGTSLIYSTFMGGSHDDYGYGIAIDSNGNSYLTGITYSDNYPTTPGAYDTTHNGNFDVFVTKLNSTGSSLKYSTFIGGFTHDYGYGIAIDSNGNSYISGITYSDNYPTTPGAYDPTYNSGGDVFMTKINPAGSSLLYSTFIGGNVEDIARGIEIDSNGNAYIGGYTQSSNFPTTPGAYDTSYNGGYTDVFVTKLNSTGSSLVYSTFIGGSGGDEAYGGITIDSNENAYVTGETLSTDYPTTSGAYDTSHDGSDDVFVTKLNSAGSALSYSTFIGGSEGETAYGIETDYWGQATITGLTGSSDYPTTSGAYDTSLGGEYDAVVTKLSSSGSSLVYSTFLGGSGFDRGNAIASDLRGNIFFTGYTDDATIDYPTTPGAYDTTPNGNYDVFVSKIDFTVLPSQPINPNGTIGNGFINLTWQTPINDGGADISNYNVYRGTTSENIIKYVNAGNVNSYNDTAIFNGGNYYYYFTAVNYVGESAPSEIITVSDIEGPVFTEDNCDDVGFTGCKFHIIIGVEDNVLVTGVNMEYYFGNRTPISKPLTLYDYPPPGSLYSHYTTISVPLTSIDPLTYRFNATDPSSNWNVTEYVSVPIYDKRPPNLKDEDSDETAYTGETFHIKADINDNIQLDSVWVRTFVSGIGLPGEWNNNSMTFIEDRWVYDLSLSEHSQYLEYQYIFKDIFSNWGSFSALSRDVVDNDPPQIIEDLTNENGYMRKEFNFRIRIEDNIGIAGAEAIYNYRGHGNQTLELRYNNENIWSDEIFIPETPLSSQLYYQIRYWDTSGNTRKTSPRSVGIIDSVLPTYIDLTNDNPTTGDPFNFRFEINDNFYVNSVEGYFEIPSIDYKNYFGNNSAWDSHYELNQFVKIPENAYGKMRYWLVIEDAYSDEVEIQTPTVTLNITDNDPPLLEEVFSNQTFDTGKKVVLVFETKDNIRVGHVKVEYWFEDEITTLQPEYMYTGNNNKKDRYRFFITLPEDSVEPLNYRIYSKDSSGLTSTWDSGNIAINDTILPSIQHIDNIKIKIDEILDVTPIVSDNIGVDRIEWEGSPVTPIQGKIIGIVTEPGKYWVTATVYDKAGNSNSTSFTVTVEQKEERSVLATVFIILGFILLIAIIISVVVFFNLKKRRETEKVAQEISEEKKPVIPTGPKDDKFLPTQKKLPPPQAPALKPRPSVITPPIYKTAGEMPRAPMPLRGDDYISPVRKQNKTGSKTQVKGELGPRETNMLKFGR